MLIRDEWMVGHAHTLLACWDGSRGGTGHTVRYAKFKDKPIVRIDPTVWFVQTGRRL